MHVGIDARFVQGANTGVTNYLLNLLRGLSRIDKDNSYSIFLSDANYKNRIPKADNFHIWINGINSLIWKNIWLPRQAKRLKIDVMHFPAYTASFTNIGNNIVTVPDVIHRVNPRWFSAKEIALLSFPIKLAIKRAKHIITISESAKNDIMRYYNVSAAKISVTLLAADESFRPIEEAYAKEYIRNKYGIKNDFILNIGVLFKRRNIERLVEAFSRLKKDKTIKHKLVIVGPGRKYFDLNEHLEKHRIKDEVIYLGYVEQDDMPLLYNAASFFIYPSLYEGFGLPVLEAMSCCKAVITSNTSSLPEVLGDTGLLVDPSRVEELHEAMERLIKDSALRDRLGKLALERSRMFNWDDLAKKTISIYEETKSSWD